MSYLHCPSCQRAYNIAAQLACPHCGVRAGAPADPTADVVAAAEQLARAMARATAPQLAAAGSELDQRASRRALPAAGQTSAPSADRHRELLHAVRAAVERIAPAPLPLPLREPVVTGRAHQALLTTVALAVLTRIKPLPARLAAPIAAIVPPRRELFGLRRAARALLAFAS